jgi:predicted dehydrogenase
MSNSEPLTAAVVGAGTGGTLSIDALHASDRFRLVAVADLDETARARMAARVPQVRTFASHEQMLAQCPTEVVCVSTYAPTHLPITKAALAAGVRGLLVEKPLGDSAAHGADALAAATQAGVPVVVPHGLMAQAAPLQVIERVHSGDIGTLRVVQMECTGWDIINAGIHWIQFFLTLADSPVESVLTACDVSTRTYRDGMQVETEAITQARCHNGVRLLLNTGDQVPTAHPDTSCLMRIIGDTGLIEYAAWEPRYTIVDAAGRHTVDVEPFPVSGHRRHLEHLADLIASGTTDDTVPRSSLQALEVVEAAYLSNRERRSVSLPLTETPPAASGPLTWDPGAPYAGSGGGRNGRTL